MKLFAGLMAWLPQSREQMGPPEKPLPVDSLQHFMTHPNPGIVPVPVGGLPTQSLVHEFGPIASATCPQYMCPKPVRMFDRGDTTLTDGRHHVFRPDREIRHV